MGGNGKGVKDEDDEDERGWRREGGRRVSGADVVKRWKRWKGWEAGKAKELD